MTEITVRFFAAAAEAAGADEAVWRLSDAPTLDELRAELVERHGEPMAKVLRSGSFLVDGTVRRDGGALRGEERLPGGSEGRRGGDAHRTVVDVLPPFAGG
ncbi:MAG: MoaD/ThiS family protein [Leucobacter sp.]